MSGLLTKERGRNREYDRLNGPTKNKFVSCETNLILPTCQIRLVISLKAVTEAAPLFIHKIVKIGVFIRYNYTACHLRSIKNYM